MCGLAGILRIGTPGICADWLTHAAAGLACRGPDGGGIFIDRVALATARAGVRAGDEVTRPPLPRPSERSPQDHVEVGLAHRRLAIINPEHGCQPLLETGAAPGGLASTIGLASDGRGALPIAALDDQSCTTIRTVADRAVANRAVEGVSAHGQADQEPATHSAAIVFNGCIYNHRALRSRLINDHQVPFRSSHSDTETLLAAWRHWGGPDALDRIEGMFAFAIWEPDRMRLSLARDRAGEKPLYFAFRSRPLPTDQNASIGGDGLIFGSTVPSVRMLMDREAESDGSPSADAQRHHVDLRDRVDDTAVIGGLVEGFIADPRTAWCDIEQVPPGTCVVFDVELTPQAHGEHIRHRLVRREMRYWASAGGRSRRLRSTADQRRSARPTGLGEGSGSEPGLRSGVGDPSNSEPLTPDRVESLLRNAVASRLEADVPLGCFLSGGVDSSLVAAFAHQAMHVRGESALRTFCVRMPDPRFDESDHALEAARHLGVRHETLDADPHPAEDLIFLIRQLGMPFGDSSILPTFWVSRAARQHVKVALSGDGGDELFLGYERTLAAGWIADRQRWLKRIPGPDVLLRSHPRSRANKLGRLIKAARGDGYRDLRRVFPSWIAADLLTAPGLVALASDPSRNDRRGRSDRDVGGVSASPVAGVRRASRSAAAAAVGAALADDFDTYLPGDLLRKVDTASMAVGLEVRCPFLDRDLMEAALETPVSVLRHRGERKGLLRAVARRHLPAALVDRPKQGFGVPIGAWFRDDYGGLGQLLGDLVLTPTSPFEGLPIDATAVRRLAEEHFAGRQDHGQRLFGLLTLAIWGRECIRGASTSPREDAASGSDRPPSR